MLWSVTDVEVSVVPSKRYHHVTVGRRQGQRMDMGRGREDTSSMVRNTGHFIGHTQRYWSLYCCEASYLSIKGHSFSLRALTIQFGGRVGGWRTGCVVASQSTGVASASFSDRDNCSTGNSFIIVIPGCGVSVSLASYFTSDISNTLSSVGQVRRTTLR